MNNNGAIYKNDRRANVNGCSRKGEESKGVEPQPQRGGGGKRRRRRTTTRWALQGFLATVYTNALNQLIILWGSFGILWDSLGFFRIPGGLLRIPRDSWFIRRIYLGIIRGYFGIIWVSWLIARIFEGFYGIVKGSLVHCKDSKGFSVILKDSFGISSGFSVLFLRVLEGSRRISISFQAARWIFQDFLGILSPFPGSGGILSLISGNFEGFFVVVSLLVDVAGFQKWHWNPSNPMGPSIVINWSIFGDPLGFLGCLHGSRSHSKVFHPWWFTFDPEGFLHVLMFSKDPKCFSSFWIPKNPSRSMDDPLEIQRIC